VLNRREIPSGFDFEGIVSRVDTPDMLVLSERFAFSKQFALKVFWSQSAHFVIDVPESLFFCCAIVGRFKPPIDVLQIIWTQRTKVAADEHAYKVPQAIHQGEVNVRALASKPRGDATKDGFTVVDISHRQSIVSNVAAETALHVLPNASMRQTARLNNCAILDSRELWQSDFACPVSVGNNNLVCPRASHSGD